MIYLFSVVILATATITNYVILRKIHAVEHNIKLTTSKALRAMADAIDTDTGK